MYCSSASSSSSAGWLRGHTQFFTSEHFKQGEIVTVSGYFDGILHKTHSK